MGNSCLDGLDGLFIPRLALADHVDALGDHVVDVHAHARGRELETENAADFVRRAQNPIQVRLSVGRAQTVANARGDEGSTVWMKRGSAAVSEQGGSEVRRSGAERKGAGNFETHAGYATTTTTILYRSSIMRLKRPIFAGAKMSMGTMGESWWP